MRSSSLEPPWSVFLHSKTPSWQTPFSATILSSINISHKPSVRHYHGWCVVIHDIDQRLAIFHTRIPTPDVPVFERLGHWMVIMRKMLVHYICPFVFPSKHAVVQHITRTDRYRRNFKSGSQVEIGSHLSSLQEHISVVRLTIPFLALIITLPPNV